MVCDPPAPELCSCSSDTELAGVGHLSTTHPKNPTRQTGQRGEANPLAAAASGVNRIRGAAHGVPEPLCLVKLGIWLSRLGKGISESSQPHSAPGAGYFPWIPWLPSQLNPCQSQECIPLASQENAKARQGCLCLLPCTRTKYISLDHSEGVRTCFRDTGKEEKQNFPRLQRLMCIWTAPHAAEFLLGSLEDQPNLANTAVEQLPNLPAGICAAPASGTSWWPRESP